MRSTFKWQFPKSKDIALTIAAVAIVAGGVPARFNPRAEGVPTVMAQPESTGGDSCLEVGERQPCVETAHDPVVGDFNEDGYLDLAVLSHRPSNTDQGIGILLGDGTGKFSPVGYLPAGDHNHGIITADLNNDGHLDLAACSDSAANPTVPMNALRVYLGDGTAHFSQPDIYQFDVRAGPLDVQAGDLNKDGNLDLVLAGTGNDKVVVMPGDGSGRFGSPSFFAGFRPSTRSTFIADFNKDGNLDVVTANEYGGSVSLMLGDGTGNLAAPVKSPPTGAGPRSVVAADWNGDGNLDVAVTNRMSNDVTILLGDGKGNLSDPQDIRVGKDPRTICAGDFNNDGKLDFAVAGSLDQAVSVSFGNGKGTFSKAIDIRVGVAPVRPRRFTGPKDPGQEGDGIVGLTATDLDGDGDLDLVATSTFDGSFYVLWNRCLPSKK